MDKHQTTNLFDLSLDAAGLEQLEQYQLAFDATDPEFITQIDRLDEFTRNVLATDESPNAIRAAILLISRNLATRLATLEPDVPSTQPGASMTRIQANNVNDFIVLDEHTTPSATGLHQLLADLFPTVAANPVQPQLQSDTTSVETAWYKALEDAGLPQGSGASPEEPRFVCGRKDAKKAPEIVRPTIDITPQFSKEQLCDVQDRIYTTLMAHQWTLGDQHMRLHPWAAIGWVNTFTTDMLGVKGIQLINDLLDAAGDTNRHGDSQADIMKAFNLSMKPDLSQLEREVFRSVGSIMSHGMRRSNAWVRFNHRFNTCSLVSKIAELRDNVVANPRDPNSLRLLDQPSGRGIAVQDKIIATLAQDLGWDPPKLSMLMERNRVLPDCCQRIHPHILLLMNKQFESNYKNNGKAVLPFVLDTLLNLCPEFTNICETLGDMIIPDLMSEDETRRRNVVKKKVPTIVRGSDMLSRVRETLKAASS